MAATTGKKNEKGLRREAPPGLIAAAVLLLLVGLGAAMFYFINGGWKTQGQQMDHYYHEYIPLDQARHGNTDPFNRENELRKKNGQPLLVLPKSKGD
jgi:hypothetical protein